jgi:hypothetical protein
LTIADLREGDIRLLDEIRRQRASDGMQKCWSDEPGDDHRGERREEQREDGDSGESAAHGFVI